MPAVSPASAIQSTEPIMEELPSALSVIEVMSAILYVTNGLCLAGGGRVAQHTEIWAEPQQRV